MIGQAARRRIETLFAPEVIAENYLSLYDRVVSR
jgi:hypothetical protein